MTVREKKSKLAELHKLCIDKRGGVEYQEIISTIKKLESSIQDDINHSLMRRTRAVNS